MKTYLALLMMFGMVVTSQSLNAQFSYEDNNPTFNVVPYGGTFTYSVTWSTGTNISSIDLNQLSTPYSGNIAYGMFMPLDYTYSYSIIGVDGINDGAYSLSITPETISPITQQNIRTTNITLRVSPAILTQPQNTVCLSGNATTMGMASGPNSKPNYTTQTTFQWFDAATKNSISAPTNSPSFSPSTANNGERIYCIIANIYGVVSSTNVLLTVGAAPAITTQPVSVPAIFGNSATFSVTNTGSSPLSYQWYQNGILIPEANLNSITIDPIQPTNLGAYRVVITNIFGSITSSPATLIASVPSITTQPTNVYAVFGSTVTLGVNANGAQPLSYQWYKDGYEIQGANLNYIVMPSVTNTDAGIYSVVVSNALGEAISSNSTVNVGTIVSITRQPTNLIVLQGQDAIFSVSASGSSPYNYQWIFNGATVSNATNNIYDISDVTTNNSGSYGVIVTNDYGSVTSSVASLLVGIPPQMLNICYCTNRDIMLTMNGTAGFSYMLQESSDLTCATNWQSISNIMTDANGLWSFTDTNTVINSTLFYRVTVP